MHQKGVFPVLLNLCTIYVSCANVSENAHCFNIYVYMLIVILYNSLSLCSCFFSYFYNISHTGKHEHSSHSNTGTQTIYNCIHSTFIFLHSWSRVWVFKSKWIFSTQVFWTHNTLTFFSFYSPSLSLSYSTYVLYLSPWHHGGVLLLVLLLAVVGVLLAWARSS